MVAYVDRWKSAGVYRYRNQENMSDSSREIFKVTQSRNDDCLPFWTSLQYLFTQNLYGFQRNVIYNKVKILRHLPKQVDIL